MNIEQKQYIKSLYMQIKNEEKKLRDKPMPKLTRKDFLQFYTTGNRLVYEKVYFERRKYLTVYAILVMWSEKLFWLGIIDEMIDGFTMERYIDRLTDTMLSICEEEYWVLPAHLDFKKTGLPKTNIPIDLFAAETAQALSEISLQLYDELPDEVMMAVSTEIMKRILEPFCTASIPRSWWETDHSNWAAVCAGCVGMTAVNTEELYRRIKKDYIYQSADALMKMNFKWYCGCYDRLPAGWKENCLKRACDSMQCYLDGMEADGVCTEGLGYYNYGMSFYAAFAEQYGADGSHGQEKESLMFREKCEQIALFQQKCYFGGGVSISFSDGSRHESFLPGLTAYLKHCYPQVQTPDYTLARPFDEDTCYRYLTNERNISWLVKYADCDADDQDTGFGSDKNVFYLPAAQWFICRDANGNGLAAKGGNNDENHNHNDIGHFLCVFNGEMLLTDLGAGEYTRDYFSDRRYEILCNRSFGHSVPIINGKEQCAGKEYRADRFVWDEKEKILTISYAGAYPKGSLEELVRCIKMCDIETASGTQNKTQKKMQITLEDRFVTNESTKTVAENIVTEYEPVVQDNTVWIRGQHGQCSIDIENGDGSMIKIIPCAHSDHAGNRQTVYRISWEVDVKKGGCTMWITFYDK